MCESSYIVKHKFYRFKKSEQTMFSDFSNLLFVWNFQEKVYFKKFLFYIVAQR